MTEQQYIIALKRFEYLFNKDLTIDEHIEFEELCHVIEEYENKKYYMICLN